MQNEGQHKPNDFNALVEACGLSEYVLHITDNPNSFPLYKVVKTDDGEEKYIVIPSNDYLINEARRQAYQIYILAFSANAINLNRTPSVKLKNKRLGNQEEAINLCNEHLALIQLCKKHFHLTAKRVKHWGKMTIKVRNMIEAWNKTDKDRYKNI